MYLYCQFHGNGNSITKGDAKHFTLPRNTNARRQAMNVDNPQSNCSKKERLGWEVIVKVLLRHFSHSIAFFHSAAIIIPPSSLLLSARNLRFYTFGKS